MGSEQLSAKNATQNIYDILGVGIGPFNLSLAALADDTELDCIFLDENNRFDWHPGLMFEDAKLQVPFLADAVSLVEPRSKWSFLAYLKERHRLFPFYFREQWHIEREEYNDYLQWLSTSLKNCLFNTRVLSITWIESHNSFQVCTSGGEEYFARNISLGIGTQAALPSPVQSFLRDGLSAQVIHSGQYLDNLDSISRLGSVTVLGSGQSGAEIVLDLLQRNRIQRQNISWFTRSSAFAPMEYSKLGLQHFTPDYTKFFHALKFETREELIQKQWQLYKGISADTISDIHDELYRRDRYGAEMPVLQPNMELDSVEIKGEKLWLMFQHTLKDRRESVETDGLICATGYRPRDWESLFKNVTFEKNNGVAAVDLDQRLQVSANGNSISGDVYVQNVELATHGVGTPDLGLAAWRSAVIINTALGYQFYDLPSRTSYTKF